MKSPDLHYTQFPSDLVMPATAQLVTTIIYGLGALVFIVYAFRLWRREQSLLPLYFIAGALLTIYFEPLVDSLGNAVHPPIGQFNILTTNGHPVPLAVLLGYVWYFAAAPLLCYDKLIHRTLSTGYVWKMFWAVVIGASLVEQIPLYFGVWIYYGYQPFKIGYIPAWWVFANTTAVIAPFLIIYKLLPVLQGWRQVFVVVIIPTGAFMGHAAAGWPMYSALGTDTENFSRLIIQFAGLCSVALSAATVWMLMQLIGLQPGSKSTADDSHTESRPV